MTRLELLQADLSHQKIAKRVYLPTHPKGWFPNQCRVLA